MVDQVRRNEVTAVICPASERSFARVCQCAQIHDECDGVVGGIFVVPAPLPEFVDRIAPALLLTTPRDGNHRRGGGHR